MEESIAHSGCFVRPSCTVRVGRIGGDAKRLQRRRIEHSHVARGVRDDDGVFRSGPVEKAAGGMGLFLQRGVVVAESADPVPRPQPFFLPERPDPFEELVKSCRALELDEREGVRVGGNMAVGIDERGQEHMMLQIHLFGSRGRVQPHLVQRPYSVYPPVDRENCLGGKRAFHRQDGAVGI